jgi:hypothetical protein
VDRHQVTHPSKSKTRSVAAIGNGCVIPAQAGIHFDFQGPMDSRLRRNDDIAVFAGMTALKVVK